MKPTMRNFKMQFAFACIAAFLFIPLFASSQANNEELQSMYKADQAERQLEKIDRENMRKNDSIRQKRV